MTVASVNVILLVATAMWILYLVYSLHPEIDEKDCEQFLEQRDC